MFTLKRKEQLEKGAAKAREMRPAVTVKRSGEYLVEGSQGNDYLVRIMPVSGGVGIDCDCLAGQNEKACYHAAAAYERHERRTATVPAAARDRHLAAVYRELDYIKRSAARSTDYETADDIKKSVQWALESLDEYEVSLLPASRFDVA